MYEYACHGDTHILIWSSSTVTNEEPPNGTRCQCGQVLYRRGIVTGAIATATKPPTVRPEFNVDCQEQSTVAVP